MFSTAPVEEISSLMKSSKTAECTNTIISKSLDGIKSAAEQVQVAPFVSYFLEGVRKNVYLTGKQLFTFGRHEGCDVQINVPTVSRTHAQLRIDENGAIWLENLSESNPSRVNGNKVQEMTSLTQGDEIDIGGWAIIFNNLVPDELCNGRRTKKMSSKMNLNIKSEVPVQENSADSSEHTDSEKLSSSGECTPESEENAVVVVAAWEVKPCYSPKSALPADLQSAECTSSPIGTQLMDRKLKWQYQKNQQLELNSQVSAQTTPRDDYNPEESAAVEPIEAVHLFKNASSRIKVFDTVKNSRAMYNKGIHSPSMGVSEEEHAKLQASSNKSVAPPSSPDTEKMESTGDASPMLCAASLQLRKWYNMTVYSPSMGVTEEELEVMRAQHFEGKLGGITPTCLDSLQEHGSDSEGAGTETHFGIKPFVKSTCGKVRTRLSSDGQRSCSVSPVAPTRRTLSNPPTSRGMVLMEGVNGGVRREVQESLGREIAEARVEDLETVLRNLLRHMAETYDITDPLAQEISDAVNLLEKHVQ